MLDFFWVLGSLMVVAVWGFLYFQTRKKIFLGIAIITLIADFFVLKDLGISLKTITDLIV